MASQGEKPTRIIPLRICIFQKACGTALFLLSELETDAFGDITEGWISN